MLGALPALGTLCLTAVVGFLPTSAAASPTPTDDLGRLCAQAADLTQAGKPADALALIEKIRGQVRTPVVAATTACEQERLAAIRAAAQPAPPAPPQNPAERAGANWDRFQAEWIKPLLGAGPALLGVVAFFLLLGRLLVFVPRMPFVKMRPGWRAGLLFGGLGLILLGSAGTVLAVGAAAAAAGLTRAVWGLVVLEWAFAALCGAVAFALYLSSRLRVSLDVRGPDGKSNGADTEHIAALLHEFGAAPPRGVETTVGTDVDDLGDTAVALTFSNKFLAAVQKVVTSIFGVTPWRVAASPAGENALTIAITRNGWTVAAANIDRTILGLAGEQAAADGKATASKAGPTAQAELHKMAAAFVLATLARNHHGFEGLCGATDWRSLGLHCIATTGSGIAAEQETKLLGAALDYDAGNLPAEVALQHSLLRESTDAEALRNYADWLWRRATAVRRDIGRGAKSAAGYLALLYRVELTFVNVALNLPVKPSKSDDEWRRLARDIAGNMVQELAPTERLQIPGPWAHAMRLYAALAYKDLSPSLSEQAAPHSELCQQALDSVAPQTAYNAACSIARNKGVAAEPEIARRLKLAFADPRLKAWARKDPELAELRKKEEFLKFLGIEPRQDFWKLEAFEPYEKQLPKAGIARPRDLYAHEVGQSDISAYLQVNPLVIKRLARLATLVRRAEAVPAHGEAGPVQKFRVEVIGALIQAGIESPADIEPGWLNEEAVETAAAGQQDSFIAKLQKSIEQRVLIAPDARHLTEWLRQLKDTPPEDPSTV
ncbi:hypothetical protein ACFRAU_04260 [Arthrobacter sp. NPDC056691]|uniref:hypothetical protein n=1 Tax=Arthrobacter sp. NPDC056691 TaxID=3345913 RepID=UPI00366B5040